MSDKIVTSAWALTFLGAQWFSFGVMTACYFAGDLAGWAAIFGVLNMVFWLTYQVAAHLANCDIHHGLRKISAELKQHKRLQRISARHAAKREKILASARAELGDEVADQLARSYPAPTPDTALD